MPVTTQSSLCPNCSGAQWLLTHTTVVAVMWPARYAASHQCDSCAVISVWTDTFLYLNPSDVLPILHRQDSREKPQHHAGHLHVSSSRDWAADKGDVVPNRHLECRIVSQKASALHLYGNQQEMLQVRQEVCAPLQFSCRNKGSNWVPRRENPLYCG